MKKRALPAVTITAWMGLLAAACGYGGAVPAAPGAEEESTPWDNGQTIAFVSSRDGDPEIYKMRPDGSQPTNLTHNSAPDSCPSWSPDGRWIAFESLRNGQFDICKMRADGTEVTAVTCDPAWERSPSWSPDGQWIAFGSRQAGDDVVYGMRVDGSEVTRLSGSAIGDRSCWSPDGERIAFVSSCGGYAYEIFKVKADGGELTRLTHNPPLVGRPETGRDHTPAWSP
jgi:Tol biopolymer transport system component